jgi:cytoskeletal protein RodZ
VDGIEERLEEKRREEEEEEQEQEEEEGSAKADMSGKADATEEENETEDANAIDRIADQLAADADEDAAWAELDEMDGTITYGQIPWPPAGVMGPVTLPANIDRARVKRMVTRYHPDKFAQKYGGRIAAEDKTRVEEKVKQVCQVVNERYAALRDA